MQSYFIKSLATWIKVIEGRCPPNESPFLVRTPCPPFKLYQEKPCTATCHFHEFRVLKDPWSMAVRLPMTGQVAEPCPFGPRLDGTNLEGSVPLVCILWNGPCTSSLLTSCGYISFHHHLHYTSWYFMACWRNTHDHLDYWLLRDTYSNRFSQNMWPRTGTHQSERKRNSPSTIWGAQRQHHIKLIINGTPWLFLLEHVSNVQVIQNDSQTAPANLRQ